MPDGLRGAYEVETMQHMVRCSAFDDTEVESDLYLFSLCLWNIYVGSEDGPAGCLA